MKGPMERLYAKLPVVAWIYGVAGLIPFIGCAGADILSIAPGSGWWRLALIIYSAVILSFLGGARWGLELARFPASAFQITLSMVPSIAGFFLLLTPAPLQRWALGGAAAAHALQWFWDIRAKKAPQDYGQLRSMLAAGAILSILAALVFG
jgi:hypothetical protein